MTSGMPREIALGENADQTPTIIDDGHSSDLMTRHLPHAFRDGLVGIARKHTLGHAIGNNRNARIASATDDAYRDIAVGHHTHEYALVAHDRQSPAIALLHEAHRAFHGGSRVHASHTPAHELVHTNVVQMWPCAEGPLVYAVRTACDTVQGRVCLRLHAGIRLARMVWALKTALGFTRPLAVVPAWHIRPLTVGIRLASVARAIVFVAGQSFRLPLAGARIVGSIAAVSPHV
jgi:hypothetical protein